MDYTQKINGVKNEDVVSASDILNEVREYLIERDYNPVNQLVGYLLSGDPTYITSYKNARNIICKLDRDELLEELIKAYYSK
ncbi:MAG: IreB family regulatory phosphoprotein [Lachnospirales bacterium]